MEIVYTLNEIKEAAFKFWQAVSHKKIIAFYGKMGAGKTTFIHALCEVKGVKDAVSSPTFSIINEYSFLENGKLQKIFHIDLYRLSGVGEAVRAGVEDCFYSNELCLIEWPERAEELLPEETIRVYLEPIDENSRMLRIGEN